jgi:DNA polymerase III delta prime subunit
MPISSSLKNSLKNLSHHAYGLIGGDAIKEQLILILNTEHSISIQGNSDFSQKRYQNFTIDDARELKMAHEMRPVTNDGKKIFIITADNINIEAQNALLKLLEEPAEYAHFFLIIPSAHILLPTVKSRLMFIETKEFLSDVSGANKTKNTNTTNGTSPTASEQASIFLTSSPAKRLEIVKKLLDDITKEKKTKQDAIDFLNSIQDEIHKNKDKNNSAASATTTGVATTTITTASTALNSLIATQLAGKYVSDRAPSLKMLLEYVALNV